MITDDNSVILSSYHPNTQNNNVLPGFWIPRNLRSWSVPRHARHQSHCPRRRWAPGDFMGISMVAITIVIRITTTMTTVIISILFMIMYISYHNDNKSLLISILMLSLLLIVNVVVVVNMLVIVIILVTIIIGNNKVHNNHCQLSQQYQ